MKSFRVLGLAAVLSAVASAASSYPVELTAPTKVGGKELAAGKYKVEMEGDKAVFKDGKNVVAEVPATVENGPRKYSDTQVGTTNATVQTIAVGGTNMKIVLKAK